MARFDSLESWLNWQEQFHPRPIDLGLERVAGVYRRLDSSRIRIPTITVAGTNGKGSCIAYLEAIYRAQGYRVGAYTSPHIVKYNERIRIDGEPVSDERICEAFGRIDAVRGDTSLSYFEFGTLAALDIFARAELDIQLLEVGLGGRLDAVNLIDPDVALVTTIALDHVDWLGDSVEQIAREKAGIFRPDVPAIIGDDRAPAALVDAALEKGARVFRIESEFGYRRTASAWQWFRDKVVLDGLPAPAFKGEHQYRNASAVIMAVKTLKHCLPVGAAAIRSGLRQAQLRGRFQLISGEVPILLDVGHNPQAVETLLAYLRSDFADVKIRAVFAMMKDKDIAGVIDLMHERVADWYLAPLNNPRAATPDAMREFFQQQGIENVHGGFDDFEAAFRAARRDASANELILIFGSFFLVSEYLTHFT